MITIEELAAAARAGKTNIMPYATIGFFKTDGQTASTDIVAHRNNLNELYGEPFITVSSNTVIADSTYNSLGGVFTNLDLHMTGPLGAEFELTLTDAEAGQELQRLWSIFDQTGAKFYTSYCYIKFGWVHSLSDKPMESPRIFFLLTDIEANYSDGQFVYTVKGINIAAPYMNASFIQEGNFTGTVGSCLSEWERVTGFTVHNKDILKLDDPIQRVGQTTSGGSIIPNSSSPYEVLNMILANARVTTQENYVEQPPAVYWSLLPTDDPSTGESAGIYLYYQKSEIQEIFGTYTVGSPDSIVQNLSIKDDYLTSKLYVGYQIKSFNPQTGLHTLIGNEDSSTSSSNHVTVKAHNTNAIGVHDKSDPRYYQGKFDTRTGSITILGDPSMIPSPSIKKGNTTRQFYNSANPFLGIQIHSALPKPSNFLSIPDTAKVSTKSYLNGIYMVDSVTHHIDSTSYTVTMDFHRNVGTDVILAGTT